MKVYWTKEFTHDKKNILDDFCIKHDLVKEWKRDPIGRKGYYIIIDLEDKEDTAQKILNLCEEEHIKTTNRSNNVAAMSNFKNIVYSITQDGASFENIVDCMEDFMRTSEKIWRGKINKDSALAHIKKVFNDKNSYWGKHIEKGRSIFTGRGEVLLVGAYKDIDRRSERLIKVADFLKGMIDEDCLIYDHKGSFYFCTFDEEETNLIGVIKYFKKPLLKLLNEEQFDYDEIFSFDKDDFTKVLSRIRSDEGGGFKDLSEGDDIALSFLSSNNLL